MTSAVRQPLPVGMELLLAYLAGLLTLINPCVLPILPILLASSLQLSPHGPLAIAAGMGVSFISLGMFVTVLGRSFGVTEQTVSDSGAILMTGFGLVLLVPQFSEWFATVSSGLSTRANARMDGLGRGGLSGQAIGGILLGAVWSPCIGPTLGGAIGLASQGQELAFVFAIMLFFALGVATIILGLGYGARSVIQRRQALMRSIAERSRPILGGVFVAVGLGILFRFHHAIEARLVQTLPVWLIDLSVSI